MMKIKEALSNKKVQEDLWKIVRDVAVPIGAVLLLRKNRRNDKRVRNSLSEVCGITDGYSDVVDLIMNSNMFEYRKVMAIDILQKGQSESYYKSVMSIMNSDMMEYRKIEAIEKLNSN